MIICDPKPVTIKKLTDALKGISKPIESVFPDNPTLKEVHRAEMMGRRKTKEFEDMDPKDANSILGWNPYRRLDNTVGNKKPNP